jgi:hypothetical protein
MISNNVVLVECKHGSNNGEAKHCPTCIGSGYVKVILAYDGEPKECEHASNDGKLEHCPVCLGAGWAGLVTDQSLK